MSKVQVRFKWKVCTADPRQYNQQRQILEPVEVDVSVDIPLSEEYIYNYDAVKSGLDLKAKPVPEPLLTPSGMFKAISLLEAPFNAQEKKEEVFEGDEEFGDEEFGDEEFEEEAPTVEEDLDTPDPDEEDVDFEDDEEWDE